MKRIYLLVAFLVGMFLVPATATAITLEELKKLDYTTAAQVLSELSKEEEASTAEKADEWVSLAERLGSALSALAKEAGVALNEFIQTPAGMITVAVLLWQVIGGSIISALVWVVSMTVLIWSFRKFHVPVRTEVVVRDGNGKPIMEDDKVKTELTYVRKYIFNSDDARSVSAVMHGFMFLAMNIVFLVSVL